MLPKTIVTFPLCRGFPFESGPLLALGEQWDSIPVNAGRAPHHADFLQSAFMGCVAFTGDSTGKCTTDKGGLSGDDLWTCLCV